MSSIMFHSIMSHITVMGCSSSPVLNFNGLPYDIYLPASGLACTLVEGHLQWVIYLLSQSIHSSFKSFVFDVPTICSESNPSLSSRANQPSHYDIGEQIRDDGKPSIEGGTL